MAHWALVWARMATALVALVFTLIVHAHPWRSLYGDALLFDVYRNGDLVGQYKTSFNGDDQRWTVEATMTLQMRWLWWGYDYRYLGVETWINQELHSLSVNIEKNGESKRFDFQRQGDQLTTPEGQSAVLPVLPTHHYNVAVVEENRVLNTLTGRVNRVAIDPEGRDRIQVAGKTVEAFRYRYRGELERTEVWYDQQGRWVGLRFADKHGGEVVFRCRICGPGMVL